MSSLPDPLFFESESPEARQAELTLVAFRGREVVSQLFEYELDLSTTLEGGLSVDAIDDLLNRPCSVRFGPGGTRVLRGRLRALELLSTFEPRYTRYRALMVPRLWQTTLYRRSRVFQHLTVLGIVESVLVEHGFERDVDYVMLAADGDYPEREYTVQYQETDFAFMCRLLEHEGIFFYFQHESSGDQAAPPREHFVLGDRNTHFASFALGPEALPYDPTAMLLDERGVIQQLGRRTEVRPGRVHLVDYNWRRPSNVTGAAPCDERTGGDSFHHHYGDHFRDEAQGARLARVRAEELMTTRLTYPGVARAHELTIGHRFEVVGHPMPELDQQYVVIELSHAIDQGVGDGDTMRYDKRFTAIPFSTPYRPPRLTPLPRVDGFVHGIVDSSDDAIGPVDPLGQYTVVVPYDLNGSPGGAPSTRRIRMAQPASGNTNIHFPLDAGAEVALVHLGGDPDRPLIVGSPPHGAARVSVDVGGVKDNRTQSLIESRGGVFIEIEDDW